jgi:hypothetical protein
VSGGAGLRVPPALCQRGHPLLWLLGPESPLAGGEGLASCDCTVRRLDGREYKGSQPILWRWVPSQPASLRPVFASQNRLAFALALRLHQTLMSPAPFQAAAPEADIRGLAARVEAAARAQAEAGKPGPKRALRADGKAPEPARAVAARRGAVGAGKRA